MTRYRFIIEGTVDEEPDPQATMFGYNAQNLLESAETLTIDVEEIHEYELVEKPDGDFARVEVWDPDYRLVERVVDPVWDCQPAQIELDPNRDRYDWVNPWGFD